MKKQESGFEFEGRFYPWHFTDRGKDLLLVDRIAGIAPKDYMEALADEHELQRPSIQLPLIATSLRHGNPDWSLEKILRIIGDLSLSEVEFVKGEDEEDEEGPPAEVPAETDNGGNESNDGDGAQPSKPSKASPAKRSRT